MTGLTVVDILQRILVGTGIYSILIPHFALLHARQDDKEVGSLAQHALHLGFTMVQFGKGFHQCQTDAGAAGSPFGLEESFEDIGQLVPLDALARIAHIDAHHRETAWLPACIIAQRYEDTAARRRVFQCIVEEIEHDARHLLLVGHHQAASCEGASVQMQADVLAFGGQLEVARPQAECLDDVEAAE